MGLNYIEVYGNWSKAIISPAFVYAFSNGDKLPELPLYALSLCNIHKFS